MLRILSVTLSVSLTMPPSLAIYFPIHGVVSGHKKTWGASSAACPSCPSLQLGTHFCVEQLLPSFPFAWFSLSSSLALALVTDHWMPDVLDHFSWLLSVATLAAILLWRIPSDSGTLRTAVVGLCIALCMVMQPVAAPLCLPLLGLHTLLPLDRRKKQLLTISVGSSIGTALFLPASFGPGSGLSAGVAISSHAFLWVVPLVLVWSALSLPPYSCSLRPPPTTVSLPHNIYLCIGVCVYLLVLVFLFLYVVVRCICLFVFISCLRVYVCMYVCVCVCALRSFHDCACFGGPPPHSGVTEVPLLNTAFQGIQEQHNSHTERHRTLHQ